eukprot:gene12702-12833_t
MSLNSPTPEHVKIVSKPSHVRWMSLQQLLTARSQAPPGLYLLSTDQGLITDIDAELRGIGGIVLGRLGLPLGHVWDGRHAAGVLVAGRLQQLALTDPLAGKAYMEDVVLAGAQERERQAQADESRKRINQLRLQELVWSRNVDGE